MVEMDDGRVWMGTRDAGLFFVSDGQLVAMTNGVPDRKINCLLAAGGRQLWVATDNGIVRQSGDAQGMAGGTAPLDHMQALAMLSDRQSNIWIGTGNEQGEPIRLERVEDDESHQLIEEFMLAANEAVARELKKRAKSSRRSWP